MQARNLPAADAKRLARPVYHGKAASELILRKPVLSCFAPSSPPLGLIFGFSDEMRDSLVPGTSHKFMTTSPVWNETLSCIVELPLLSEVG